MPWKWSNKLNIVKNIHCPPQYSKTWHITTFGKKKERRKKETRKTKKLSDIATSLY
jgi:hypothetical protein